MEKIRIKFYLPVDLGMTSIYKTADKARDEKKKSTLVYTFLFCIADQLPFLSASI